jgi:hypothetical protein
MKRSPTIHSAQIVQDRIGHGYLLVKPGPDYRSADSVAVRDDILERIGKFDLEIIETAQLPKTPQGKMILVVRLMERPDLNAIYKSIIANEISPSGES